MKKEFLAVALLAICVSQALPQEKEPFPGAQVIGHGWDVLGKPDDPATFRKRIISASFLPTKTSKDSKSEYSLMTSSSVESLSRKLSVESKAEAEFGGFSGSVEAKFSSSSTEKTEQFVGVLTNSFVKGIYQYDQTILKDNLDPQFKADLNNPKVSPLKLFKDYGTHVIHTITVGGRFNYYMSSDKKDAESEKTFDLACRASYKGAGSASGSVNLNEEQKTALSKARVQVNCAVVGGKNLSGVEGEKIPSQDAIKAWEAELETHSVFIGRPPNSLRAIWKFCDNPQRADEIEFAFTVKRAKRTIENPILFSKRISVDGGVNSPDRKGNSNVSGVLQMDAGYKILCGGASVQYSGDGVMLFHSYPQGNNQWVAAARASVRDDDSGILTISALAIYDPSDDWKVEESVVENIPRGGRAHAANSGKQRTHLVGGGAKVYFAGDGSMLTGLEPTANGFNGWAMDCWTPDHSAQLKVFAIHLSAKSPAAKSLTVETIVVNDRSEKSGRPAKQLDAKDGYVLVGGGARVSGDDFGVNLKDSPWVGQWLTASLPNPKGWYGSSKEHQKERHSTITVYAIGLKATIPELKSERYTVIEGGSGSFVKQIKDGKAQWLVTDEKNNQYTLSETGRDKDYIFVATADNSLRMGLPLAGGSIYVMKQGETKWTIAPVKVKRD